MRLLRRRVGPSDLGLRGQSHIPPEVRRNGQPQTADPNLLPQAVQGIPLRHGELEDDHSRDTEGNFPPHVHRRFQGNNNV